MSGKILVVGDCCTSALDTTPFLGEFQVVVSGTIQDAVQQLEMENKIYLALVCRDCFGDSCPELMQQLDAAAQEASVPLVLLNNDQELKRALQSAHPHNGSILQAFLNQSSFGITIGFDPEPNATSTSIFPMFNQAYLQLTGRTREELLALGWGAITHPEDRDADLVRHRKLQAGEIDSYSVEKRILRPDGTSVWVELTAAPFAQPGQELRKTICLLKDISDRKAIEERLHESERSKAVLLKNLPGLAYRCCFDPSWTMTFVSEGCEKLTGYAPENLLHNAEVAFNDIIAPEYRELLWTKWQEAVEGDGRFQSEYEIITKEGERRWVLEMGQVVYDSSGVVEALEGIIIDITERKESELQLKRVSELDFITGLPNRRALKAVMAQDSLSGEYAQRWVVVLNLRRLNTINAVYGFSFCESLQRRIARRLEAHCTSTRQLYLASYGRFAFYLQEELSQDQVLKFCRELVETLKGIALVSTYGCGIGIRKIEGEDDDPEILIHNGGLAAENADPSKPFACRFFDQELAKEISRRGEIEDLLLSVALGEKEDALYLEYQPIIEPKTHSIMGFEALARLNGGNLGIIPPGEFIPIAEENQLIVPLGEKIARRAFRFLRGLIERGREEVFLSINVSALQLAQDGYVEEFFALIQEEQVNPSQICIEVTESVFVQNYAAVNEKLITLREAGITVAIDDFGTGYSSLARERELSVNCIKIHKSFIDRVAVVREDQVVAADIISMAHRLGHRVVAEGVEHSVQKEYLLRHGCDLMQGFLFSRPVPDEKALSLLEKGV